MGQILSALLQYPVLRNFLPPLEKRPRTSCLSQNDPSLSLFFPPFKVFPLCVRLVEATYEVISLRGFRSSTSLAGLVSFQVRSTETTVIQLAVCHARLFFIDSQSCQAVVLGIT